MARRSRRARRAGDREPARSSSPASCVVDLETTGLSPASARICEIGAVRVEALELTATFETLANPGVRLAPAVGALTGIDDRELRRAPSVPAAVRRFLAFAGDSVLVAHNARFDLAFLDRETERQTGRRIAAPVIDTVGLARRLLAGRTSRAGLASLARFFGTSVRPCHRALPDAEATAEILLCLIGLAQERGAETVADLQELGATRARRVHAKRSLAFGAPERPGVYLFLDRAGQVLYVGRARDLRARLRSYFRSERQRPAVEAALGALDRVEWRVLGSELEAGLEELRLLRELRPPANARGARPDRYVYLRARGDEVVVTGTPGPHGPLSAGAAPRSRPARSRPPSSTTLRRRCRACAPASPRTRTRCATRTRRACATGSTRSRTPSAASAASTASAPPSSACSSRRSSRASAGRSSSRAGASPRCGRCRPAAAPRSSSRRGSPRVAASSSSYAPEHADELLLVASFLRRPPPELKVLTLSEARAPPEPGSDRGRCPSEPLGMEVKRPEAARDVRLSPRLSRRYCSQV